MLEENDVGNYTWEYSLSLMGNRLYRYCEPRLALEENDIANIYIYMRTRLYVHCEPRLVFKETMLLFILGVFVKPYVRTPLYWYCEARLVLEENEVASYTWKYYVNLM